MIMVVQLQNATGILRSVFNVYVKKETSARTQQFLYASSSSWNGAPVKEHGCFLDIPPGGTIGRTPTCCMEAKVEWFEISFDCS